MKLYHVNDTYLDELRKIEPKIPQPKGSNGTKTRPFVGIILTINSVNYIAPLSSQKHNMRTDFKVFADNGRVQVATVRTAYMFPIPPKELQLIDFSQELINDRKYAALLINEINYIKEKENSKRLIELANKTYEYAVTKRYNFENFCCDFLALESYLKSTSA